MAEMLNMWFDKWGFTLNLFLPCGLVSRVHLHHLWHLCGPKNHYIWQLFNTHQHDFNIKQDNLSLYLHARKPRMSRGPRRARVWTLHPIQSKERKLNDSWFWLKKIITSRKKSLYQVRTAQHSSCALHFRGNTSSMSCLYLMEDLRDYRSQWETTKRLKQISLLHFVNGDHHF